ncbi:hypothetical protein GMB70_03225 [Turicibacter sanguinis]|nr:hypothetical protein [Turicibacter sanguinis]
MKKLLVLLMVFSLLFNTVADVVFPIYSYAMSGNEILEETSSTTLSGSYSLQEQEENQVPTDEEGTPENQTPTDEEATPENQVPTDEEGTPENQVPTNEESAPENQVPTDEETSSENQISIDKVISPGKEGEDNKEILSQSIADAFQLSIIENKQIVGSGDNYEYIYTINYKIPRDYKDKLFLEIQLNGNIELLNNTIINSNYLSWQGYDADKNIIRVEIVNRPDAELTGSFEVPVNFIQSALDKDIASASIKLLDEQSNVILGPLDSGPTSVEKLYQIGVDKHKVGSDIILSDGEVLYRITIANRLYQNNYDLKGFSFIDYLPQDRDFDFIEAYYGDVNGNKISSLGNIEYDSVAKEVKFSIDKSFTKAKIYGYVRVKYKNISHDDIITNNVTLYDPNDAVILKTSAVNRVDINTVGGTFDKRVVQSRVGYKGFVDWQLIIKSGSQALDKIVIEDKFEFHNRLVEISPGRIDNLDPNTSLKIYIKTKNTCKTDYCEYRTVTSSELSQGASIIQIEDEYLTDDNYITDLKFEILNVAPGFGFTLNPKIKTQIQPSYEDGSPVLNNTPITNIATMEFIQGGQSVFNTLAQHSTIYMRTYEGMLNKQLQSNVPTSIGDIATYKLSVSTLSTTNLPNPVVWDVLPNNLEYLDYEIQINGKKVNIPHQFEYDQSTNILRWKFNYTIPENSSIDIILNTKLTSIAYTTLNKSGLSTQDIPSVQGVINPQESNHLQEDGEDFDGNGQIGDYYVGANEVFQNLSTANINIEKFQKISGNQTYTQSPIVVSEGTVVDYKLVITNSSQSSIKKLELVDILPSVGDKNSINDTEKNSEFNVVFDENSLNITKNNTPVNTYTISFSDNNPERTDASGNSVIGTGSWGGYTEDKSSFKIEFPDDFTLDKGEQLHVTYSIEVPTNQVLLSEQSAFNNFSLKMVRENGSSLFPISSNTVQLKTVLKPGGVKVTKVDADDQTPLAGAEFKILAADGSEVKTGLTTNDQGIIEVNDLKPGHYQLVETQAPTGYVLDATPIPFEIVKDQQAVLELKVENTLRPGGVKVTKVDADDQTPLAGAEFKILAADGSEVKTGLTTNDQGIIEVNDLKPGHYQLVETQAPTGYVLDATPIPFEIVKDQQAVLELKVENTLELETDKPETDKPETDKPETDKPGTDKPITGFSQNYISILGLILIIIGGLKYKNTRRVN